jgi:glycosyltransferase involved in cell wall biosynthesis
VVESFPDPRIRYHFQQNSGPATALNQGIRLARGEFIAILDSDDYWLPHMLETALAHLAEHPEAGLFYAQTSSIDENGNPLGPIQGAPPKYPDNPLKSLIVGDVIAPATIVVRRACYDRLGPYDEVLQRCEDWDMWLRFARHYSLVYYPGILARYRYHSVSLSGSQSDTAMEIGIRKRVLDKAFADPVVAREMKDVRGIAYRNLHMDIGLRAARQGLPREALHHLAQAVCVSPDPGMAVIRLFLLWLFLRFLSRNKWTSRAITWLVSLRRR